MADAIVSSVLEQLTSIISQEIQQEVRLVAGVKNDVKMLTKNLHAIQDVLVDAEQRQLNDASVRRWVDQLQGTSYDMEDVLDEWKTAMMKLQMWRAGNALAPEKKVCLPFPTSCFCIKQAGLRRDIALKIKAINENLDETVKSKDIFNFSVIKSVEKPERVSSVSFVDVSKTIGRDEEKKTLVSKLLCESSEQQQGLHIISIVGMGGIGKTTLAQLAYNDDDVKSNFHKRMWVCVSDPFDEYRIAKAIIEALEGFSPNLGELQSLLERIDASVARKKFLLVFDDVWTEDPKKWEPFHHCLKNGMPGSKILVTTRKETVARMMESTEIIPVKELSKKECWLLFERFAFFGRPPSESEKLKEIGEKIVDKCKGLPLAAKTIGSLLRYKKSREEWQNILDSELWKIKELENDVFAPLLLSYNDLPSKIKPCFSYCAVFLKDYSIKKDDLIKLWMAQGYLEDEGIIEMEIIGQNYFDYLAARSFFQEFEKDYFDNVRVCKMHDLVHDFARFVRKSECFPIEITGPEESVINNSIEKVRHSMLVLGAEASFPSWIFGAHKLRSLLIDIKSAEACSVRVLRKLFNELTCLRAFNIGIGIFLFDAINEIPKEIEKLIHLRYLKLDGLQVEELPEAFCELYNLQSLEIKSCRKLKRLPHGIGKLVNLRHLTPNFGRLDYMPKGIGRLTGLRTLAEFIVSDGGQYGRTACNFEDLKHLNHLREVVITIRGSGNVTDVDEAKKAELEKKKNLSALGLSFDKNGEVEATEENEADHEAICEAIRPPPNLEELVIHGYRGKIALPNWLTTLTSLKVCRIADCFNCESMPPLGKLPSLEKIYIVGMPRVKRIGDEFLGMDGDPVTCSSSSSSPVTAFPKLKVLGLVGMDELEQLDIWTTSSAKLKDITIMPHLNSLEIEECYKLKALPDHLLKSTSSLKRLVISDCPILEERFKYETGEDWHKISHIPNIRIGFTYVQRGPYD